MDIADGICLLYLKYDTRNPESFAYNLVWYSLSVTFIFYIIFLMAAWEDKQLLLESRLLTAVESNNFEVRTHLTCLSVWI